MENKPIFLSGLNGIRALAAVGVMIAHINDAFIKIGLDQFSLFGFTSDGKIKGWALSEHGVTMFFVLSGFLITFLLQKEVQKNTTVNLKMFYIRRILRIWPLYYLYLILSLLTLYLTRDYLPDAANVLYYTFFLANIPWIFQHSIAALYHLWSIGVEEQFYLFWPLFFIRKIKNIKLIILSLIALQALFRVAVWYFYPFSNIATFSVVNRFDCMMIGGLGAVLFMEKSKIIELANSKVVQILSWIIIVLLIFNKLHFFNSIMEIFLISGVTLCIIVGQINIVNRIINLENKVCSQLGKISFGLYVYHPLVILILIESQILNSITSGLFRAFIFGIIVLVVTFIIAKISFTYFESKFLKLKHRYSVIDSTNVPQPSNQYK